MLGGLPPLNLAIKGSVMPSEMAPPIATAIKGANTPARCGRDPTNCNYDRLTHKGKQEALDYVSAADVLLGGHQKSASAARISQRLPALPSPA